MSTDSVLYHDETIKAIIILPISIPNIMSITPLPC